MKKEKYYIAVLILMSALVLLGLGILVNTAKTVALAETKAETLEEEQIIEEDFEEVKAEGISIEPIGVYRITHYCACEKCCGKSNGITASGTVATEGRTCAMEGLPIGTQVLVVETGEILTVEDRFGDPSKTDRMDIFIEDHDRALALGTYESEVYIVEFGEGQCL
jgi:3D (Asp-Asp-Asp) domain-containing protein